ncbi:Nup62 [Drosophila busckii]|uniref:Nup62 n=1 Tax=Drosophila busckii TaxID=30019 RepID=A0A0M4EV94_DROBS|nr:nuclear pore glycoprotein p62 [Drosophila busckii]XP_017837282.1 nuclear pore glycoprotein p62 [Drosophila busckii]XP_017837283.1 nuclear pore glycoprotein p62 [Drosophila busckii]ALC41507.1 Nup62 [Drosophila busckii]
MAFQLPPTTTAASTGFSFGLNTAQTTANPAAALAAKPTFSFPTPAPTINQGGGDADNSKAAPPPFGGFGLAATTSASVVNPLQGIGTGFGAVAPTATAPPAAAPTAAPPAFGGFGLQSGTTTATTTAAAAAPAAAPQVGGGLTLGISVGPKSTVAAAPAAAVVAPLTSTAAPTAVAGQPTGFANLSTATKTTDSAAVTNASQLTYNQLEEHINKWTLEFEEQEKVFAEQATQINAWDKLLINNNQKIIELNDAVGKVKNDQQVLDQELEFIATQHKELEESLAPLEKEFINLPRVDHERSQTYLMVENLDTQLKQMSEDLKEIIDNLNEANKGQDNTDPIIQIGKILNAHMSSLQWIESQSTHICKKLDDIGKIHETQKRDIFRAPY